jgi:hypothetical protein
MQRRSLGEEVLSKASQQGRQNQHLPRESRSILDCGLPIVFESGLRSIFDSGLRKSSDFRAKHRASSEQDHGAALVWRWEGKGPPYMAEYRWELVVEGLFRRESDRGEQATIHFGSRASDASELVDRLSLQRPGVNRNRD